MTSVFRELPLSYAVLSAGRRCGSASAVHEPSPAGPRYRASSIARAEPSAGATKRFKTVELLVAERDWQPPRPRFARDQVVGLRVVFADVAVRGRVKQGRWDVESRTKGWQLPYDRVIALGLNGRIVDEPASSSGCQGSSGENLHADA